MPAPKRWQAETSYEAFLHSLSKRNSAALNMHTDIGRFISWAITAFAVTGEGFNL